MKSYRALAALLGAISLAACGDKAAQNISAPTAGSAVKFFNFGVGDPSVNFYANDQKVSGVSTSSCSSNSTGKTTDTTCLNGGKESTSGTAYGAAAVGSGLYASIAPGSYTLSGRVPGSTSGISSTQATLENGKFYSYYLSGIYNTTSKQVEGFVVEDPLPAIAYDSTYIRFVNAISNAQPMGLVLKSQTDSTKAEIPVGGAVAYKSAGAFAIVPPDIYTVYTRYAGSTTNVITRKDVSFGSGRVYTITAYGDITATSGSAKPALDNTANR